MRTPDLNCIEPVFLGWDKPILWSLIDWLKTQASNPYDYSEFILIVPSKRAQARISELLILDTKSSGSSIISPKLYSNLSSCLQDYLAHPDKAPISITEALIAWEETIRSYEEREIANKLISAEHLATYLEQLRKDLLSHNLKISDISSKARDLLSESQAQLCNELNVLNTIYEETITQHNFYDDPRDISFSPPDLKYIFVGFHYISPLENYLISKFKLDSVNIIGAPSSEKS